MSWAFIAAGHLLLPFGAHIQKYSVLGLIPDSQNENLQEWTWISFEYSFPCGFAPRPGLGTTAEGHFPHEANKA